MTSVFRLYYICALVYLYLLDPGIFISERLYLSAEAAENTVQFSVATRTRFNHEDSKKKKNLLADFFKLTLPNDSSYLIIAQLCVRELAKRLGFEDIALREIELGLDEAASNVIEHAFEADESGTFEIIAEGIALGIKIIVKEKGIPFDPDQFPPFDPGSLLDDGPITGMGLFLMKAVMDEVSFVNLGSEGKETHLIKYLHHRNIEEQVPASELKLEEVGAPKPSPVQKTFDYDVRLMGPREAIEVSRCAYKSHGYSYFDDHIYYPDRIIALNKNSQMISAVAVSRDNAFMGHAAMLFDHPGDRIAELTFAFVNPEYRGSGCLNRMTEFLFDEARKRKLAGVYAYAVTNHVYSQKPLQKYGINDCGILIGTSPATWRFRAIADEDPQRISMVLSFKYVMEPDPLTLYAPLHHREMIEKLYGNINARHIFVVPETQTPKVSEGESVIETGVLASEGNASIAVSHYGVHVIKQVRSILHDLCLKQIATIELLLSLEDPATFSTVTEFEKMGFFFAGILPGTTIGEALILQYLNNVAVDYEKISVYSEAAKGILAYVKQHDPDLSLV
jgi:anti-sigma regulatory factor (Ser/Thr protein kinase)